MKYIIRQMKFSDIDPVYEIECQVFPNPWPKSFFENDIHKHNTIALVADLNNLIIGYALADCVVEELHITNIAVAPPYQHKGVGKALLSELERIGLERDCIYAYLEVRVNNSIAINFYKNFGYKIITLRKNYYLNGTDAYVMAKEMKEVL
jgi:ribosomal-protein-alanine N-acetyltransferase|uniref:[Ribosomal protein bS18]-alanine N-acetyltransferase n=1 Tax=candidate division WOR-3 bacterium TaxID=2052148 RepID=A0A7V3RHH3_UNCW3